MAFLFFGIISLNKLSTFFFFLPSETFICIYWFCWWYLISPIGFLHSFSFFFFFLFLWLGISNDLSTSSLILSSVVEVLYWIIKFNYFFFGSIISVWFFSSSFFFSFSFSRDFYLFVKLFKKKSFLSFCMYCFPDFIYLSICVPL